MPTSQEIKEELMRSAGRLPSGSEEQESTYQEYGLTPGVEVAVADEEEEEVSPQPEEDILSQPHDDPKDEYLRQRKLKKEARREFVSMAAQEQQDYIREYGVGAIPERVEPDPPTQQQAEQGLSALKADFIDLRNRYGDRLVDKFSSAIDVGDVKLLPGDLEFEDAVERKFLSWLNRDGVWGKLDHLSMREALPKEGEDRKPLKSRARDLVSPEHVKPTPKPRKPRRPAEPRYRAKDVSDRLRTLLQEDMKKNPSEYWERVDD